MIWRVRFETQGGHVHCHLFCAPERNMTFAKCGNFAVRRGAEFKSLVAAFAGAEFVTSAEGDSILVASADP